MTDRKKIKAAHVLTGICLLVAGVLLGYLFKEVVQNALSGNGVQATRFEFDVTNSQEAGFVCEETIYTENGITKIDFSGEITIGGTAEIMLKSVEDGAVVYHETYTDVESEKIALEIEGVVPDTYYTLVFTSADASEGYLLLTSKEMLVKQPATPEKASIKEEK